jgi:GT2 family glycosyltransferase
VASVCAVLVTYNRCGLLEQALDRLAAQERRADAVLVVDNACTDGTTAMLAARDDVEVLRLPENLGGAGGFAAGLRHARAAGHDWYWLMDDDTFPEPDCLSTLLKAAGRAPRTPSLLTSAVRWKDGSLHPMNRPWPRTNQRSEFVHAARVGLVPVRNASFVSTMIHRDAVDRHGLPLAHYFIWHDDTEYTRRMLNHEPGYLVPESVALHWTERAYNVVSDDRGRFYFKVRNHLWMVRGPAFTGWDVPWGYLTLFIAIRDYLRSQPSKRKALTTVASGLRDGARRPPAWTA